jgi:hypothetical protein
VSPTLTAFGMVVRARRRKHPLPPKLPASVRIPAAERSWQLHPAGAPLYVAALLQPHMLDLPPEIAAGALRKQRDAVPIALFATHHDLVLAEIDVLDPRATALQLGPRRPGCEPVGPVTQSCCTSVTTWPSPRNAPPSPPATRSTAIRTPGTVLNIASVATGEMSTGRRRPFSKRIQADRLTAEAASLHRQGSARHPVRRAGQSTKSC